MATEEQLAIQRDLDGGKAVELDTGEYIMEVPPGLVVSDTTKLKAKAGADEVRLIFRPVWRGAEIIGSSVDTEVLEGITVITEKSLPPRRS